MPNRCILLSLISFLQCKNIVILIAPSLLQKRRRDGWRLHSPSSTIFSHYDHSLSSYSDASWALSSWKVYHHRPLGATEIKATDWTASNARLGMPRPRATNATRDTRVEMQINVISVRRISVSRTLSGRDRRRLRIAPREGFMLILSNLRWN